MFYAEIRWYDTLLAEISPMVLDNYADLNNKIPIHEFYTTGSGIKRFSTMEIFSGANKP